MTPSSGLAEKELLGAKCSTLWSWAGAPWDRTVAHRKGNDFQSLSHLCSHSFLSMHVQTCIELPSHRPCRRQHAR